MGQGYAGNLAQRLLRLRAVRIPTTVVAGVLAVVLLAGGCSDDDTPVTAGNDSDGSPVEVPDRAPDLVGTITSVEPFVPINEDCTPPEDLDPDDAVSSADPPICTADDNDIVGSILVEEDPADPEGGRKISFTATSESAITGATADGTAIGTFSDLAEGQTVETWVPVDGACAESYPEQCELEAVRVTG
jgi:hypothetical protein